MSTVLFVTGAGRGLGSDIARAALAAGHRVVATGRHPDAVTDALGGRGKICWSPPSTSPTRTARGPPSTPRSSGSGGSTS